MRYLSQLTLLLLSAWSWNVWATSAWQKTAYPVKASAELQAQIDDITAEIFNSPLKSTLCGIYMDPNSASHSLGISLDAAHTIYKGCPGKNSGGTTKIMAKNYYLSFEPSNGLDSWTDYGNRTFIFADATLGRQKLKSIIVHEIAMATDTKTNMLYTTYLMYRNQVPASEGQQVVVQGELSAQEKSLQQAFNMAGWRPLSMTFATLRAFNIERALNNQKFTTDSHGACVSEFMSIFKTMKSLPEVPTSEQADQIAEMLASAVSKAAAPQSPEHEKQIVDFLMAPNLQLKDHQGHRMSFCQFMTRPMLTSNLTFSFFGSGPRPRLTGGSGGQGGQSSETKWLTTTEVPKDLPLDQIQITVSKLKDLVKKNKELQKLPEVQK